MNAVAIRAEYRTSGFTVQLRDYAFASHVEQIANVEPAPTLALRLSRPPELAQGHHDVGVYRERNLDLGVTMFHPRKFRSPHAAAAGGSRSRPAVSLPAASNT